MIKNQMFRTSYFKRRQKRQKTYITQFNIAKNKALKIVDFIAMLKIKCYN